MRQAAADGLVADRGLRHPLGGAAARPHVKNAKAVIIATDSDEASVLVTLTVRQLTAGQVRIIAAAREAENAPLLKQSGAHHVIVSSSTAGRLLGLSTSAPPLIDVVEDLLTPGAGHGAGDALRGAQRGGPQPARAGRPGDRAGPPGQGACRWPARAGASSSRPATCSSTSATTATRRAATTASRRPSRLSRRATTAVRPGFAPLSGTSGGRGASSGDLDDGPGVAGVEQAGQHLVRACRRWPWPWPSAS